MNKYQSKKYQRKSIRLKGYDYSNAGLYFITICCKDRVCRFGDVVNGEMVLNEFGQIAHDGWIKLVERFSNFELDVFQIMPNHMHGIIVLKNIPVVSGFTPDPNKEDPNKEDPNKEDPNKEDPNKEDPNKEDPNKEDPNKEDPNKEDPNKPEKNTIDQIEKKSKDIAPSIPDIVGAYKSLVSNGSLKKYKLRNQAMGKLWQSNYYEHIIRNEQSFQNISSYIINNPKKWEEDKFYKK